MGLVQPDPVLVCDGDTSMGFCPYGADLPPECVDQEGWTVDGDTARCFSCSQHEAAYALPDAAVYCLEGVLLNGETAIYKFASEKRDLSTWSGPYRLTFMREQSQSLHDAHRDPLLAFKELWPRVATEQEAEEW